MDVTLAVPVFSRTEQIRGLLESVPPGIADIIVADDGDTAEREALYREHGVDVIDLPFDAGVGRKRAALAAAIETPVALCLDPDHRVPSTWTVLVEQLLAGDDLGGVAGSIVEPARNRIWNSGKDLTERWGILFRSAPATPSVELMSGNPLVRADFTPQAFVVDVDALDDYAWDPAYANTREHLDFAWGHAQETDWAFAVSPSVHIPHYPTRAGPYGRERDDSEKKQAARQYFNQKWGVRGVWTARPYLLDSDAEPVRNQIQSRVAAALGVGGGR